MARNKPSDKELPPKGEDTKSLNEDEELVPEEPSQVWKTILKYAITVTIAAGLVFAVLGINGFFLGGFNKAQFYRKLSDAFTVPGLILILLALLFLVASKGAFTGLGYALRHVLRMLMPFFIKKDISYAEYLENREHRKTVSIILCFLIIGAVFLTVGIVFIFFFYKYYTPATA